MSEPLASEERKEFRDLCESADKESDYSYWAGRYSANLPRCLDDLDARDRCIAELEAENANLRAALTEIAYSEDVDAYLVATETLNPKAP